MNTQFGAPPRHTTHRSATQRNESTRDAGTIAQEAAEAFKQRDALAADLACADARLRALTAEYGAVTRTWGLAPHHLRQAAVARGLL